MVKSRSADSKVRGSNPVQTLTFSIIVFTLRMARSYIKMKGKRLMDQNGPEVTMGAGTLESGVQSLLRHGEKKRLLKRL